jgi:hypothetical protein
MEPHQHEKKATSAQKLASRAEIVSGPSSEIQRTFKWNRGVNARECSSASFRCADVSASDSVTERRHSTSIVEYLARCLAFPRVMIARHPQGSIRKAEKKAIQ